MSTETVNPIHVMMRFSDKMGPAEGTIEAHRRVTRGRGCVWFGKMGKPLAKPHIATIKRQIAGGTTTYLYLTQRVGRVYHLHRGTIADIGRDYPKKEERLIPHYYVESGFLRYMSVWVKLKDLRDLANEDFKLLYGAHTGMPITESLAKSMAGLFIVRHR